MGRIKVTRRKIRQKQLLCDPKETRGYWELKDEALSHYLENLLWKTLRTFCKTVRVPSVTAFCSF